MKSLSTAIEEYMHSSAVSGSARKARRISQVYDAWKNAVVDVYSDAASIILTHTNAVYIMREKVGGPLQVSSTAPTKKEFADKKDPSKEKVSRETSAGYMDMQPSGKLLILYSDDSLVRSDIDARQEFLKMRLRYYGEHVESFRILPSRMGMRQRHPFSEALTEGISVDSNEGGFLKKAIPSKDYEALLSKIENVGEVSVRTSLKKAVTAYVSREGDEFEKKLK